MSVERDRRLLLTIETLAAALDEARKHHADFVETLRFELDIPEGTIFPEDDVTDKVKALVSAAKELVKQHQAGESGE